MKVSEVASGFPSSLFLVLVGVTLLFAQAKVNGTLDQIAKRSVRLARGNPGVIPLVFFFLAMAIASIGPGNIAATAMLAPIAMSIAGEAGISAFLMTVMVATGANSGALSPFAPTGIIANGQLARIGITGVEWPTFINNLSPRRRRIAGYFVSGTKLLARGGTASAEADTQPWSWRRNSRSCSSPAGSSVFSSSDVGVGRSSPRQCSFPRGRRRAGGQRFRGTPSSWSEDV
jgi:hypothetical protein